MKYLLGLFLGLFFFQASAAPSHDALNLYVDFVNKSVHGMFMVNRLLVEYNLELNKYVDLESEKSIIIPTKTCRRISLKTPTIGFTMFLPMNWLFGLKSRRPCPYR